MWLMRNGINVMEYLKPGLTASCYTDIYIICLQRKFYAVIEPPFYFSHNLERGWNMELRVLFLNLNPRWCLQLIM